MVTAVVFMTFREGRVVDLRYSDEKLCDLMILLRLLLSLSN